MAKGLFLSKAAAIAIAILTISAIGSIITMVIMYNIQIGPMHPTPRPTIPPSTPFPTGPQPSMRLPGNLIPERYKVSLTLLFYTSIVEEVNVTSPNQSFAFTGDSTVYFHCVQKTKTIYLHSKDLMIDSVKVEDKDTGKTIKVVNCHQHKDESDFLEIEVEDVLREGGKYSLLTVFKGEMTNDLTGLYASQYNEGPNAERFLAVSQMQPTDARKVFPCFDEPAMKAVFEVTINHRQDTEALSNSKAADSSIVNGMVQTIFNPTPKMSTYLLAFSVSEFFNFKESNKVDGRVTVRTYARPEAIKAGHADYAASITGDILKYYGDYFDLEYPEDKLDQIAVPDFSAGAMENWGLVTYRETALLYQDKVSSSFDKEWVATVIAHELAHQWFGNLVTMKWWNDVWLNEGFATYISSMGVDHVEKDWNIKDMFAMSNLITAFEWDSLASSHPLSSPANSIETPSEITELFDAITYTKGAAVLRMLEALLTERIFKSGLRMYLKEFQYNNTVGKQLWECLQKARVDSKNFNVAELMDTWTNQIGYPVVTINTTDGEVYQKLFSYNQTNESDLEWQIPVNVMSQMSGVTTVMLMSARPGSKVPFISKDGQWILANVNGTGYFRVNYNPENWNLLLAQLESNPDLIPVINRGQIVDDAFNLARAKLVDVVLALNSTRFLRNETAFIPWNAAVRNLEYFIEMFDRSEVYGPMQVYLRRQASSLYNYFLPYTQNASVPKDHSLQHNQVIAVSLACSNGMPECQHMAKSMFKTWMNSNGTNRIHPNLRSTIYCQALAAGGGDEWEFAWEKFQSSTIGSEKDQLRYALSCTKKIWLLNRYLEYTLDSDKIRKMDVVSTIGYIAKNVVGQALAWNFVRAHWSDFSREFGGGVVPLGLFIDGVTHRFSTPFELLELEQFQMDHDEEALGSASRALEQAIERTQANIQWVGENKQKILEWFRREVAS